mmetsp:Transcript_28554/g.80456  ORF Transcript_28554/g.80456 Transcript_28554/m.80456 type:complete len:440 (-) Transcript_28554:116-1435(-)
MRLVDDEVLPREFLQRLLFGVANFVCRDADIPRSWIIRVVIDKLSLFVHDLPLGSFPVVCRSFVCETIFDHCLAIFPFAVESDYAQGGTPPLKFVHPVGERRFRNAHQVRALDLEVVVVVGKDGYALERLSQPHFVGEDSVETLFRQVDHPVQRFQLVGLEGSELDRIWLLGEEDVLLRFVFDVLVFIVGVLGVNMVRFSLSLSWSSFSFFLFGFSWLLFIVQAPFSGLEPREYRALLEEIFQTIRRLLLSLLVQLFVLLVERVLLLCALPLAFLRLLALEILLPAALVDFLLAHLGLALCLSALAVFIACLALRVDPLPRAAAARVFALLHGQRLAPLLLEAEALLVGGRGLPLEARPILGFQIVVVLLGIVVHALPSGRELHHGISHAQIHLLADRCQLLRLEVQEGRLGLFDLRRHRGVWVACLAAGAMRLFAMML